MVGDNDGDYQAESDCFWEPGNYKRTTKRISDGYHLCNELIQLVQERGELEAKYASSLRAWSKKWNEKMDKGTVPEYGTMAAAWKSTLCEADQMALLHVRMKERMDFEVAHIVKQWQKDNFHKTLIRDFKEKKEMDDAFKKAQKPWEKRLREVQKTKAEYHSACQKERSAALRERNAITDTSLSIDQKKKFEEDLMRLSEHRQISREKYDKSLREINEYNAKYMEDMGEVYEKCMSMEKQRLLFFQEQLKNLHRCLDLSRDTALRDIYKEFYSTLEATDANKDLRLWSKTHGVDMVMAWPVFEEYQPEMKNIGSRKTAKVMASGDGIALTAVQFKSIEEVDVIPNGAPPVLSTQSADHVTTTHLTSVHVTTTTCATTTSVSGSQSLPSPFPEDDWDDDLTSLPDTGDPGIPVRALYDYEALEDDELTFRKGDIFEKLEDQDDQGWCKGRLHGHVGLFPASYVKDVPGQ
ncbi:hypothetical protein RvY_13035 [Ramazzottius varieornatus]|uniref:F-BAR domain-containing protein n=1 Tax=Ramazzottius varieornatus TaxID=947166 RepID=A0A1D1VQK7_RAMVA|nr:hypothetical protein RvY_13035 [Ramazzottius varieornatus]